jgi:hypothetical protein
MAQLEPENPFYNTPIVRRLKGRLDAGALERALDEIVRRHESLRTVFPMEGEQPVQVVLPSQPFALSRLDLQGLPEAEREEQARQLIVAEIRQPFDLVRGPLMRGLLVQTRPDEHLLALALHHICTDGPSLTVLFRELAALYEAFSTGRPSPLQPLPVQFADYALWQRERLAGELLVDLLEVVQVEVAVAAGPDEVADVEVALLREHVREQRVAGDVERHAQEQVGAALIELAGEPATRDIKLEETVTRRQAHGIDLADIPCADKHATAIGIGSYQMNQIRDLVDGPAAGCAPVPPLGAVNRPEVAVGVGPLVPDVYPVVREVLDVGVPSEKPQKLVDDALEKQTLGGSDRKALSQVEPHLAAEHAQGAGSGPVGFFHSLAKDVAQEVQVSSHELFPREHTRRCFLNGLENGFDVAFDFNLGKDFLNIPVFPDNESRVANR